MINNFRKASDETGRSMIEMLGVLAIVGVLSVGGIAGYSKAMEKFKVSKSQDDIMQLLNNIRSAFGTEASYLGLSDSFLISNNFAPKGMITGTTLQNAYGGKATVTTASSADGMADGNFIVTYGNLPKGACSALAASDWGNSSSGLVSIKVVGTATSTHTWTSTAASNGFPIPIATAISQCSSNDNSIIWEYR